MKRPSVNNTTQSLHVPTGTLKPWKPHHAPILPQIETGAWAPGRLTGLKNCLPMDVGAGSSSQVLSDMAHGASPTYRGTEDTAESTDPTWTAEGLSFDGGDQLSNAVSLLSGGGTVMLVFRTTDATAAYHGLYSEYNTVDVDPFIYFGLHYSGRVLRLLARNDAAVVTSTLGTTPLNDGMWRTITCTYDTSALKVYLDGSATPEGQISGFGATTVNAAYYGRSGPGNQYIGDIAYAVRVARILTTSEIARLHNYIRRQVAGRGIDLSYCPLV